MSRERLTRNQPCSDFIELTLIPTLLSDKTILNQVKMVLSDSNDFEQN